MLAVFGRIQAELRKSVTFDIDTACAQHALLRSMRYMTTWLCDAYASWLQAASKRQRPITALLAASAGH